MPKGIKSSPCQSSNSNNTDASKKNAMRITDSRKRINSLWKRKKGLIKKSFFLSQACQQNILLAIYDPRLNRMTHFSSNPDFTFETLAQLKKDPTINLKTVQSDMYTDDKGKKKELDFSPQSNKSPKTKIIQETST